jgi:hypothetical protein
MNACDCPHLIDPPQIFQPFSSSSGELSLDGEHPGRITGRQVASHPRPAVVSFFLSFYRLSLYICSPDRDAWFLHRSTRVQSRIGLGRRDPVVVHSTMTHPSKDIGCKGLVVQAKNEGLLAWILTKRFGSWWCTQPVVWCRLKTAGAIRKLETNHFLDLRRASMR